MNVAPALCIELTETGMESESVGSRGLESFAPILSRGVLSCRQETEQAQGRPSPSTIVGCPDWKRPLLFVCPPPV